MLACIAALLLGVMTPHPAAADTTAVARIETVYVPAYPAIGRADSIAIARLELDKQQAKPWWWSFGTAIAVAVGLVFTWWRIKVSQGSAAIVHYDDTFREYLARFADRRESVSIRSAAAIGLGGLAYVRDPLTFWDIFRKRYPFRDQVVSLFAESFRTETDEALLGTIRDELVRIGPPALGIVLRKHKNRFPRFANEAAVRPVARFTKAYPAYPDWIPTATSHGSRGNPGYPWVEFEKIPADYRPSRDVISGIIRTAKFGDLANVGLSGRRVIRLSRWVRRWIGRQARRGRVWIEQNDLENLVLVLPYLRYAELSCANLTSVWFYAADLQEAKLQGACLIGASILFSDVTGVDLSKVFGWKNADWWGTNWWMAHVTDEQKAWFEKNFPQNDNKARRAETIRDIPGKYYETV